MSNTKQSKHTPGAWKIGETINLRDTILSPQGGMVAKVLTKGTVNNYYNAALIAAAPELLCVLQHMIQQAELYSDFTEDIEGVAILKDAKLAIAKARGEG